MKASWGESAKWQSSFRLLDRLICRSLLNSPSRMSSKRGGGGGSGGVNVNQVMKEDGSTPLHVASYGGHVDVVKVRRRSACNSPQSLTCKITHQHQCLLESGAHVNQARTSDGASALLMAAQQGHEHVCKCLLTYGANINQAATDDGATALNIASDFGHKEVRLTPFTITRLQKSHDRSLLVSRLSKPSLLLVG